MRIVADDGRQWVVRESVARTLDQRRGDSLLFISDRAIRRVRIYPTDWFERPDEELIAVSMHR